MQKLPILAALTALVLGQPAAAQDAPATRTAVVDHRDLDLSTDKGARTLDRRIWRAVVEVCGTAPDYDLEGKNQVRECRRDTRRLAAADAELAIAEAKQGQPIRVTTAQK